MHTNLVLSVFSFKLSLIYCPIGFSRTNEIVNEARCEASANGLEC